ncbi:MAG: hypothetical protein IKN65_06670 [Clostridia bacterium]|nr:hypothetical protein [Clostridia bacterium]
MTKEEAIKTCKQVRKYFKGGKLVTDNTDAIYEALTMAIEALKEQKTSQLITNGIGVRYCSNCRRIDNKYSVYER